MKYLIITEFGDILKTNSLEQAKAYFDASAIVVDASTFEQLQWDINGEMFRIPIPVLRNACTKCGAPIPEPAIMCTDCSAGVEPDDLAEHNKNEAKDYDDE